MMANRNVARAVRLALFAASAASAGLYGPGAAAQQAASQDQELEQIVVTGSRIARQDFVANSPIQSVSQEQIVANADVTLDTYLNTLPQVNPAGGTTSNNPGNGGQSNIDLRGLGSNRNIILIDGRRPMVSGTDLTVDLNTIPAAMIESIEVITGGAGATYGADAVAGAVNIRLKKNFEGVDIRTSYSNTVDKGDAEEYGISFVLGGKFGNGGHAMIGYDRASRESITKGQREFSAYATSTTGNPPQGALNWASTNPISEAAVDALFGTAAYGNIPASAVSARSGRIGWNRDGTLAFYGVASNPLDVQNFRDPLDVNVNKRFYPDFYSYNFDAPNLLVLPLDRNSFMGDISYELENGVEFFGQVAWTEYNAATGLAPSPVPTPRTVAQGLNSSTQVGSSLVVPGQFVTGSLVVPATNPYVNADLRSLLNSRTGDDPRLVGSGATEPFLFAFRPLVFGLRQSNYQNTVVQYMGGARGPLFNLEKWDWEFYMSQGNTEIENKQSGNVETQRLTNVLADPSSGSGACAAWNPFLGSTPMPDSCRDYLGAIVSSKTELEQTIGQFYIRGDAFELPAGALSVVLGAEYRRFSYDFAYAGTPGPFSGFNVGDPDGGKNKFEDYFAEALIPILKDAPYAKSLDLSLGYRSSTSSFKDTINDIRSDERDSDAWKVELSWAPLDSLRFRGSYQKSAREPNFGELFSSSTSFPQIFDPCAAYSDARAGADGAALAALCVATGVPASQIATYTPTPGAQVQTVTDGNTNLKAEEADTYTVGMVYLSDSANQWLSRFRGSIDYYNIKLDGPILGVSTNAIIGDCYNYFGNNPTYDVNYGACQSIIRSGGPIAGIDNPLNQPDGSFQAVNGGELETSGIDIQLAYGMDLDWLGAPASAGGLEFSLLATYILEYIQSQSPTLPGLDYAGTVSYFGAGLGQSFPEWKATFNIGWDAGPVGVDLRARYIDSMENRMKVDFPGEDYFGVDDPGPDVDSVIYLDAAISWEFLEDTAELRVGVNNLTDEEPQLYAPNVQSGTDPSTYDVVGRRAFAQLNLKF
jgi:iron complex outermembrane receptor protein